ncbi:MAG: hypothetical protein SGJ09_16310 [Phycisphaerae bacterium]|nr:hypothetical protein [Phycisphaerae bacterium]
MLVVVADSSPINHLVRLGRIELLPQFFSQVVVPTQVADEMRQPATPEAVRAFIASPPPWFNERAPSSVEKVAGLAEVDDEWAAGRIYLDLAQKPE